MRDHASGHTDWQAPRQRGVPVVHAPVVQPADTEPRRAAPPPRPPVTGWSPTSWRSGSPR
jgi:hypothetical protein